MASIAELLALMKADNEKMMATAEKMKAILEKMMSAGDKKEALREVAPAAPPLAARMGSFAAPRWSPAMWATSCIMKEASSAPWSTFKGCVLLQLCYLLGLQPWPPRERRE